MKKDAGEAKEETNDVELKREHGTEEKEAAKVNGHETENGNGDKNGTTAAADESQSVFQAIKGKGKGKGKGKSSAVKSTTSEAVVEEEVTTPKESPKPKVSWFT